MRLSPRSRVEGGLVQDDRIVLVLRPASDDAGVEGSKVGIRIVQARCHLVLDSCDSADSDLGPKERGKASPR